ncbi:MAG: hypothetical protein FJW30_00190 [Acidobacteria bacterium]|nr:hypothetical protein [Acidobacteriota bacterium]
MKSIDCRTFATWCEDLEDRELDPVMKSALEAHRADCPHCAEVALLTQRQRRAVHSLPRRNVPLDLAVGLRVVASKELARRRAHRDFADRVGGWRASFAGWMREMWRPFGVPMAGGLASACVLFSALMPNFAPQAGTIEDVPAAWFQQAEVGALSPFGVNLDQITLDVRIDSTGRVIDYEVPAGENAWTKNAATRRTVENNLIFMQFEPAKFFGQPAGDKVRITIRRSQVDVKG